MKKVLIGLAALASATIVSCQKDYVISSVPQEQPVEFSTYLGRNAETKGTVLDSDALEEQGFGVLAYNTGDDTWPEQDNSFTPNFMYNQKVNFEGGAWKYAPIKYWPNGTDNKISFFAYAPYTDNEMGDAITLSANNATTDPTLTYNLSTNIADHVDVCFAGAQKDQVKTADEISFNFYHALAKVGFTVQALVDEVNEDATGTEDDAEHNETATLGTGTSITLKELQLEGNFYTKGTLNLATSDGTAEIKDNEGNVTTPAVTDAEWADFTNNETTFTILTSEDQDNQSVVKEQSAICENNPLMIFPQEFTSSKITVRVVYDVTTTDSQNTANSSTVTNEIEESFNFTFEAGKGYTFCLHIGMQSINFTAEVSAWDDQSGTVVNVPINPDQN